MDVAGHGHDGGNPALDPSLVRGSGDNIYVSISPGHSFDYHIDVPSDISAAGQILSRHPEGLFWYHPHIHGLAQRQVSAGMASAILIGSPKNSLRRTDGSGQVVVDSGLIGKIDEQILILKDIELAVDKLPGEIGQNAAAPATWIGKGGANFPDSSEAGFLPTACTTEPRGAWWCVPALSSDKQKIAWLFTVNGQVLPHITTKPGHYALLRIANTSPTVTYALRLAKMSATTDPTKTPPDNLRRQRRRPVRHPRHRRHRAGPGGAPCSHPRPPPPPTVARARSSRNERRLAAAARQPRRGARRAQRGRVGPRVADRRLPRRRAEPARSQWAGTRRSLARHGSRHAQRRQRAARWSLIPAADHHPDRRPAAKRRQAAAGLHPGCAGRQSAPPNSARQRRHRQRVHDR